jgi:hypothetical protein
MALVICMTRGDEEEIGEAIDVFHRRFADDFAVGAGKRDHQTLGAPRNRAGKMQMGGSRAAAWQDEGFQRLQPGVQPVDIVLDAVDLRLGDP